MKHLLTDMTAVTGAYPETYFAGANTSRGFVSAYPALIREGELTRLYILKGGSGTGKSTLMRKCAARAQLAGASVTLLLCSSDPASADAVILKGPRGTAAVLDGTAPHTLDPALPGAAGEIVNLGQCWHTQDLVSARGEITEYVRRKQTAYGRAYRYLAAYGEITEAVRGLLAECILHEKMDAAVRRILSAFPRGGGYREEIRHTAAVAMGGLYRLNTFGQLAQREFAVADAYGTAPFFLAALRAAAAERRCPLYLAPAPGEVSAPFEAYLPDAGAAFRTVLHRTAEDVPEEADGEDRITSVNMQRFLNRRAIASCRGRLRFADRCREMLMEGALESLSEARICHFALEEIYKKAMDFDAVAEIGADIADGIVRAIG